MLEMCQRKNSTRITRGKTMTDKQINEYISNLAEQEIIKDKIKQIDELQNINNIKMKYFELTKGVNNDR